VESVADQIETALETLETDYLDAKELSLETIQSLKSNMIELKNLVSSNNKAQSDFNSKVYADISRTAQIQKESVTFCRNFYLFN
jgi:Mg2+ and Co2+ transporter CorA